jgi:hypothetical protein
VAEDCILDLAISARRNTDELLIVVLLVLGVVSHIDVDAGIDGVEDESRRWRLRRRRGGGERDAVVMSACNGEGE